MRDYAQLDFDPLEIIIEKLHSYLYQFTIKFMQKYTRLLNKRLMYDNKDITDLAWGKLQHNNSSEFSARFHTVIVQ